MPDNPPPSRTKDPHKRQVSFVIYSGTAEVGHAVSTERGHAASFFIGVSQSDRVELRATDYPWHVSAAVPYMPVYLDGDQIGMAWPHESDHKGYVLKLDADIPDNSEVLLFMPRIKVVSGGRKPKDRTPRLNHS